MHLLVVDCRRDQHDEDDEPRHAFVFAADATEASALCCAKYGNEGYTKFKAELVLDGQAGPPRVIGYAGQGPFTWSL
jgi:hypothetical protein